MSETTAYGPFAHRKVDCDGCDGCDERSARIRSVRSSLAGIADRVVVAGREWYWLPADGVSTSTLPVSRIEALLGEVTMRTLGTVMRMHAKFEH